MASVSLISTAYTNSSPTSSTKTHYIHVVKDLEAGVSGFALYPLYDPVNGFMYVSSQYAGSINVINSKLDKVVHTIGGIGYYAWGMVYAPSSKDIYVATYDENLSSGAIYVINAATNRLFKEILTGYSSYLFFLAYSPANGEVYVTSDSGYVSAINTTSNTLAANIAVGFNTFYLAYDPADSSIWVNSCYYYYYYYYNCGGPANDVAVINSSNTVNNTITGFNDPTGIAFDPANNFMYVTNAGNGTVEVLNSTYPNNAVTKVPTSSGPVYLVYNPSNQYVYVMNYNSASVTIVTSDSIPTGLKNITVGTLDTNYSYWYLRPEESRRVHTFTILWHGLRCKWNFKS